MTAPALSHSSAPVSPVRETVQVDFNTPRGSLPLSFAFDRSCGVQNEMFVALSSGQCYEAETTFLLAAVLKPGDVFVDIGAHVGYFSVLASQLVGPEGLVVSFEPAPDNYAGLVEHLRLNNVRHAIPLHCAAGAEETVLDLHLNADNDGGHALWDVGLHPLNEKSRRAPRVYPTYVTTVDRILATVAPGRIKAFKIDTEGGEHAVLIGAMRTLATHKVPFVIAEINASALVALGSNHDMMFDFMEALGYEVYTIHVEAPQLRRMDRTQPFQMKYVFNVLFRHVEAPAIG